MNRRTLYLVLSYFWHKQLFANYFTFKQSLCRQEKDILQLLSWKLNRFVQIFTEHIIKINHYLVCVQSLYVFLGDNYSAFSLLHIG
jgi:hypothetical protein